MAEEAQPGDILIVGSAHSGVRGDFRPRLFQCRRGAGSNSHQNWEVAEIPVDGPTGEIRIMGLAVGASTLLAVAGSKDQAFLATFDIHLNQTSWNELPGASDPHGLIMADSRIWVVSTGTNQIICYELSAAGPSNPTCAYLHPSGEPQHFNGIARHEGRLILSAFGVAAATSREVSNTGYMIDIASGAHIRTGLDQPHSPLSRNKSLFFCESKPSLLWLGDDASFRLEGYLRGLAVAPDGIMHVARSSPRPPHEKLRAVRGDAGILSIAPDGKVMGCQSLTGMGAEVYDLMALPSDWSERAAGPAAPPV